MRLARGGDQDLVLSFLAVPTCSERSTGRKAPRVLFSQPPPARVHKEIILPGDTKRAVMNASEGAMGPSRCLARFFKPRCEREHEAAARAAAAGQAGLAGCPLGSSPRIHHPPWGSLEACRVSRTPSWGGKSGRCAPITCSCCSFMLWQGFSCSHRLARMLTCVSVAAATFLWLRAPACGPERRGRAG